MVKISSFPEEDATEVQEFFELCDRAVISSNEDLEPFAPELAKLSKNRQFLADYMCKHLKTHAAIDTPHSLLPTAFIPHYGKDYVFRVIVWPEDKNTIRQGQYKYFHNHDINFLTCGYAGSGYVTEIFDYDFNKYSNTIGEIVDMKFVESSRLVPGLVTQYEAGTDVHMQYLPERLSISINLVQRKRELGVPECSFRQLSDERFEVTGHAVSVAARDSLFHAAAAYGGENCLEPLLEIAQKHPYMRLRASAWHALMQFDKNNMHLYFEKAQADEQKYVRDYAQNLLSYHTDISNEASS